MLLGNNRPHTYVVAQCGLIISAMGRPFFQKNCPLPMGGSGPPSNAWFPGYTRVFNPNGISIGSAVSVGLTIVTDRQTEQTDRQTTYITVCRIYVRSTGDAAQTHQQRWCEMAAGFSRSANVSEMLRSIYQRSVAKIHALTTYGTTFAVRHQVTPTDRPPHFNETH